MPEEPTPERLVSLRPARPDDDPLLLRVYASTRADELALVPWSEEQRESFLRMQFDAQQYHYQNHYADARHEIILLDDEPVGRVYVAQTEHAIKILDITILPEHRNAGIGTPLIRDLQREAAKAGKSLQIYVESYNPSLHLFERLGFSQVSNDGINILMEWRPEEGEK